MLNGPTQSVPFAHTSSSCAKSNTLDDLLRDSKDKVLNDLLGRQATEVVYDYFEKFCSCDREDISEHLPKFLELLEEIFGKASKTIGTAIARNLFEELGWEFLDNPAFEFFDYLQAASGLLEQRAKSSSTENSTAT